MVFAIANAVITAALDHVLALGARWLTLAKISINVVLKASWRKVVAARWFVVGHALPSNLKVDVLVNVSHNVDL